MKNDGPSDGIAFRTPGRSTAYAPRGSCRDVSAAVVSSFSARGTSAAMLTNRRVFCRSLLPEPHARARHNSVNTSPGGDHTYARVNVGPNGGAPGSPRELIASRHHWSRMLTMCSSTAAWRGWVGTAQPGSTKPDRSVIAGAVGALPVRQPVLTVKPCCFP